VTRCANNDHWNRLNGLGWLLSEETNPDARCLRLSGGTSREAAPEKLSYGQQRQIIGLQSQALILILRYTALLLAPANWDDREPLLSLC
jgi:hypothetical protein